MHYEIAGKVINLDFFLDVLRSQGKCKQRCREAGGGDLLAKPRTREESRPRHFRPHFARSLSRYDRLSRHGVRTFSVSRGCYRDSESFAKICKPNNDS